MDNPKRKKDKYNPYKLYHFKDEEKYIILIRPNKTINYSIEVSQEIYCAFNSFELEDKSQMNKYERHIEHSIITDITLYNKSIKKQRSVEDTVISNLENEKLYKSLLQLPKIQSRRIKMYFFDELTQKEIAAIEKTSIRAIQYSISIGLKNLKKLLN